MPGMGNPSPLRGEKESKSTRFHGLRSLEDSLASPVATFFGPSGAERHAGLKNRRASRPGSAAQGTRSGRPARRVVLLLAGEVAERAAYLSGMSGRTRQRVWKRGRDRWVAVALNFLRPGAAGARMSTPSAGFASSVEGRPAASPVATARRPDGAFRTCDHEPRNAGLPEHGWRERENMPMRSGAWMFVDPILEGQRKRVRVWARHDVLSE